VFFIAVLFAEYRSVLGVFNGISSEVINVICGAVAFIEGMIFVFVTYDLQHNCIRQVLKFFAQIFMFEKKSCCLVLKRLFRFLPFVVSGAVLYGSRLMLGFETFERLGVLFGLGKTFSIVLGWIFAAMPFSLYLVFNTTLLLDRVGALKREVVISFIWPSRLFNKPLGESCWKSIWRSCEEIRIACLFENYYYQVVCLLQSATDQGISILHDPLLCRSQPEVLVLNH